MKLTILCFLLIANCFSAAAQDKLWPVWKKNVQRTIDIRTARNNTEGKNCRKIADLILEAIKRGYITVEHSYDKMAFTWEQLDRRLNPKPVTINITDPATGNTIAKIWDQSYHPDSVYTYRVEEEWTFNYLSNKITIEIKSITPARNKYNVNGKFIGCLGDFTISYKDFRTALELNKDLEETFNNTIWQSYFAQGNDGQYRDVAESHGRWVSNARIITEYVKSEDVKSNYLTDVHLDTSMNAALIYRIESGKINAWSTVNIPFAKQLTAEEVKALTTDKQKIDTTIQIQNGYVNVINNRDFSPDHINAYEILEKWSFRPADGETEVTIKGIAPICDIYGTGQSNRNTIISRKTLFWVDYNDILPIIRKEVPYYPTNNFTVQIWNQFFTADTKPILEN